MFLIFLRILRILEVTLSGKLDGMPKNTDKVLPMALKTSSASWQCHVGFGWFFPASNERCTMFSTLKKTCYSIKVLWRWYVSIPSRCKLSKKCPILSKSAEQYINSYKRTMAFLLFISPAIYFCLFQFANSLNIFCTVPSIFVLFSDLLTITVK